MRNLLKKLVILKHLNKLDDESKFLYERMEKLFDKEIVLDRIRGWETGWYFFGMQYEDQLKFLEDPDEDEELFELLGVEFLKRNQHSLENYATKFELDISPAFLFDYFDLGNRYLYKFVMRFVKHSLELYEKVYEAHGSNVVHLFREEYMTDEFKLKILKTDGLMFRHFREVSYEMIVAAVKQNSEVLKYISKDLVDKHISECAIRNNPLMIRVLEQDEGLVDLAIEYYLKLSSPSDRFLRSIDERYLNRERVLKIVMHNGWNIMDLREEQKGFIDEEVVRVGVEEDYHIFPHLEEVYHTFDICRIVVNLDCVMIKAIKNEEMLREIVKEYFNKEMK